MVRLRLWGCIFKRFTVHFQSRRRIVKVMHQGCQEVLVPGMSVCRWTNWITKLLSFPTEPRLHILVWFHVKLSRKKSSIWCHQGYHISTWLRIWHATLSQFFFDVRLLTNTAGDAGDCLHAGGCWKCTKLQKACIQKMNNILVMITDTHELKRVGYIRPAFCSSAALSVLPLQGRPPHHENRWCFLELKRLWDFRIILNNCDLFLGIANLLIHPADPAFGLFCPRLDVDTLPGFAFAFAFGFLPVSLDDTVEAPSGLTKTVLEEEAGDRPGLFERDLWSHLDRT